VPSANEEGPDPSYPTPIDLGPWFVALEKRLRLRLDEGRASFVHRGIKGDTVESAFREYLEASLPRHFSIGTGEVIDISGARSRQADVVVANQDQPFRAEINEPGLYLIEGVTAVGEVKSSLTTSELSKAVVAGTAFKRLRSTYLAGDTRIANPYDFERYYMCPPFFVVAFESNVAIQTLLTTLDSAALVPSSSGEPPHIPPVDAVFILGSGMAMRFDTKSALGLALHDGTDINGWAYLQDDSVLVGMLEWLGFAMPRVHRLSSITPQYFIRRNSLVQTLTRSSSAGPGGS
jgi:hypothetical protein